MWRIFLRQAPFSNQKTKTGDVKQSNGQHLPAQHRWRVELWGEGGGGDTVKNDGAKTHSQQGGQKGALFLQES